MRQTWRKRKEKTMRLISRKPCLSLMNKKQNPFRYWLKKAPWLSARDSARFFSFDDFCFVFINICIEIIGDDNRKYIYKVYYRIRDERCGLVFLGVNRGWGRKWFQFYHREPFSWLDNLYTHARIVESKHFVVVRQTSMWKVVGKLLLYDLNCKMLTIPIPAANAVQHNAGHARGSQLERVASQQRRILKEEALFKIYKKKTTICAVVDSLSFSYCTRIERE